MQDRHWVFRLAGVAAIASAVLLVVSLKAPDRLASALTVGWNVLLLPGEVVLWRWLRPRSPRWLIDAASGAGIAATLSWAAAPITGWWRLEPVWIGLEVGWWLGIGWALRREWKWLGGATLALGIAAGLGLAVRVAGSAADGWFFLGELRLPMLVVWIGWLGALLITRPGGRNTKGRKGERTKKDETGAVLGAD